MGETPVTTANSRYFQWLRFRACFHCSGKWRACFWGITSRSDLQGRVEFDGGNEFLHSSVLTGFSSHVFVGTLLVALVPLGTATTMRAVILAEPSERCLPVFRRGIPRRCIWHHDRERLHPDASCHGQEERQLAFMRSLNATVATVGI
jgi:hypothetical protein